MKVYIKGLEIAGAGTKLAIRTDVYPRGSFLGNFVITEGNLIWCKGRIKTANGKRISWEKFIKDLDKVIEIPSEFKPELEPEPFDVKKFVDDILKQQELKKSK